MFIQKLNPIIYNNVYKCLYLNNIIPTNNTNIIYINEKFIS